MARFRRTFARRRVRRNWQWVRQTFNDTAVVTPPGFYQEDLLQTLRSELGLAVQFPDITIWRVRIKISAKITWVASPTAQFADGITVALFVDDPSFNLQSALLKPYSEKYMHYSTMYYSEAVMLGERGIAANNTDYLNTGWLESKARRRLGNLEDSLILQVCPTGSDISTLQGISVTQVTLLSLGRR
jgi:hypothetical protein